MAVNLYNDGLAVDIAKNLLETKAIKISLSEPFVWASGWKSPIYCDTRLSLSYPKTRKIITKGLTGIVKDKYPDVQVIAGVATAGVPQGTLVAESLELPFIYARSGKKGHGMGNLIEGAIVKGQKTVIIEDLVSTGGSSLQATEALRQEGLEVLGVAAVFTYAFGIAKDNFKAHHANLWCLSDYPTLIDSMLQNGKLKQEQEATLKSWRSNPAQWDR